MTDQEEQEDWHNCAPTPETTPTTFTVEQVGNLLQDRERLDWLIKYARRGDSKKWIEFGFPNCSDARASIDIARGLEKHE